MPILQHWDALTEQSKTPDVRKTAIHGSGASLVRVSIARGTSAERHSHEFEQFVQVISGSGTLETEEGVERFGPGSIFHFLPNTWHAAIFDEDTVLVETNLTKTD
jgi:quercetin dioxygenase-like cupin family protein